MKYVHMNGRQLAILALLVLFALLAVAPVLLMDRSASGSSGDPAYQALSVFARSQNGDRTADGAAAQVYPTLNRRVVDGRELYTRLGSNGTCWELDLKRSVRPYETEPDNCA